MTKIILFNKNCIIQPVACSQGGPWTLLFSVVIQFRWGRMHRVTHEQIAIEPWWSGPEAKVLPTEPPLFPALDDLYLVSLRMNNDWLLSWSCHCLFCEHILVPSGHWNHFQKSRRPAKSWRGLWQLWCNYWSNKKTKWLSDDSAGSKSLDPGFKPGSQWAPPSSSYKS